MVVLHSYLILHLAAAIVFCAESPCTTPNGERATCKDVTDCDILLQALSSKDQSLKKFLKASSCGDFMICCGTSGNFTAPEVKPSETPVENKNTTRESLESKRELLPLAPFCGIQHYDDYSHQGNKTSTSIDEFPWLVYISLYKQKIQAYDGTYELRCGGVLISNRYFLTAAECNAIPFDSVQIGIHERFKNLSCQSKSFGIDCNDPFITAKVDEKFDNNKGILLVRLAQNISYSDYVRPICLPFNEVNRSKVGDQLISSGWGDATLEVNNIKTKKEVQHVIREPYSDEFIYVSSTNYSNCFGDEGGPLMHKSEYWVWFLDAIIPPYFCLKNTPAMRINQETIDWILEKIRP